MPRKTGVLVFAAFLLLSSFVVRYFGTGGFSEKLHAGDLRVVAALQYIDEQTAGSGASSERTLIQAWLDGTDGGYRVSLGLRVGEDLWLRTVDFDNSGTPLAWQTKAWTGMLFPTFLRYLSVIFVLLWFVVALVWPNFFAVKCPDCPSSFFSPAVTNVEESTVWGGGFDKDGYDLPGIFRRDYVCPRCGYRKVTYQVVPSHSGGLWRATPIKVWTGVGMNLNPKELDWYEKILEKYRLAHEDVKNLQFPTHDAWKAFYDELKASEHEERLAPPRAV